jgi:hypothetical protein
MLDRGVGPTRQGIDIAHVVQHRRWASTMLVVLAGGPVPAERVDGTPDRSMGCFAVPVTGPAEQRECDASRYFHGLAHPVQRNERLSSPRPVAPAVTRAAAPPRSGCGVDNGRTTHPQSWA